MMTDRRFVPHFSVTTIDGQTGRYADVWQRKNLLLVLVPTAESPDREAYLSKLRARTSELTAHDTSCVITSDDVVGVRAPAIVIADRWGEIAFIAETESIARLPAVEAMIDRLRHVQSRCPECEGEAR
jgi:hypothetical protein